MIGLAEQLCIRICYIAGLIVAVSVCAQHKVTLLTGKEIEGKIVEIKPSELLIEVNKGKAKTIQIPIERYRIFSVNRSGLDSVLYKPDSAYGNYLSAEQMQFFIWGEQDAMKGYRPWMSSSFGFILGASAGYVMVKEQNFLPIVIPVLYVPLQLIPKVRVNKKYVRDLSYLYQEDYLYGYERVARSRKVQRSLWYSLFGLAAGFSVMELVISAR